MTLDVRFEPQARDELRAAKRRYDDERPGLGDDLVAEVTVAIEHIVRWPDLAPQLPVPGTSRSVRLGSVRRFPFAIVYAVVGDALWVIAVAHRRRRPYYWRDRVGRSR